MQVVLKLNGEKWILISGNCKENSGKCKENSGNKSKR